ncbi:MAG: acyl carrier protein [Deltaproteobacteria bacterium]|nr:acyl carrier protein [Deltaproteobacteria bacterium]MBW2143522.1 acyl carrier protein [Deltaproteobacteria bacterium]
MELFSEIKEMIVKLLAIDEEEVTEDAHLQFDLGADSLALMNLAMSINQKYSLELLIDDMVELENVGELISLVESKIG